MAFLIDDIDLAVATILGEAEGEGYDGQKAVATVLRNRMRQRFYSDGTVAGTVLAPYQFSLWNTKEARRISMCLRDWAEPLVQQCRRAWLETGDHPVAGLEGAVMYHASNMTPFPEWANSKEFVRVTQINKHIFYKRAK